MSNRPSQHSAAENLTICPAGEGETQSAPPVAPTPSDVGAEKPASISERGVNPGKIDEGRRLQKDVAALDDPTPNASAAQEFPIDPKTGGLPADHVRNAGPEEMEDPPEKWGQVDEESDESFPASDPPGNY